MSDNNRSIAGKRAIVTGAASGMGRATAILFAAEGARLAICDVNAEGLAETEAAIRDSGGEVLARQVDLSDRDHIRKFIDEAGTTLRGIDILVNNAGVSMGMPIDSEGFENAWDTTLAVNLTAQAIAIRAALPHLLQSGAGRIVNVASTEGLGATPGVSPYTASKHGVIGLTRSLAVELGRRGITVNCVCPGPINTGMTAMIPDEHKDKFARRRTPIGRYGEPEEVAQITLSLALPAASYITGAIVPVDGGLIAQNT